MSGYVSATLFISSVWGKISGEHSCVVPGVFLISSVDKSDRTGISVELGGVALLFSASKLGCSYSHSHALAYKSSCLRFTSGSGLYSCDVIRDSYVGWGLTGCELLHSHTMEHLRLVGARFAYQIIVTRWHLLNNIMAYPTKFSKRNFTPLMICFQV